MIQKLTATDPEYLEALVMLRRLSGSDHFMISILTSARYSDSSTHGC